MIINGSNGLSDVESFFEQEGVDFFNKAIKPNKVTLLHDFINESIYLETQYCIRKAFDETIEDIYEILDLHQAEYKRIYEYRGDEYNNYIMKKLGAYVLNQLSNEVFTLLFQDREVLKAFNECAAKYVRRIRKFTAQNYFERDGTFFRCNYWPKWLKDGLFYREKGHCAICCTDLTGLYSTGQELAIDHIVPLAKGGTNDPTNLQILCKHCNSAKGARSSNTKGWVSVYW
ncbi:HNH endonuclease [Rheinheimera sp. FR7-31]|uniref:HNH endonuclease n=1 Tax=Rheinheimera fenheensis TaxID=3152295 RepID=UPI00325D3907